MTRKSINISLTEQEFDALYASSQRELRHPRDQARYLLRGVLLGTCDQFANNKSDALTFHGERVANAGVTQ